MACRIWREDELCRIAEGAEPDVERFDRTDYPEALKRFNDPKARSLIGNEETSPFVYMYRDGWRLTADAIPRGWRQEDADAFAEAIPKAGANGHPFKPWRPDDVQHELVIVDCPDMPECHINRELMTPRRQGGRWVLADHREPWCERTERTSLPAPLRVYQPVLRGADWFLCGGARRALDPAQPTPDPPGLFHVVTREDATSESRCIGEGISPRCALDTWFACHVRNDPRLCERVMDFPYPEKSVGGPRSHSKELRYRIIASRRLGPGDIPHGFGIDRVRPDNDERFYHQAWDWYWREGDVRIDTVEQRCGRVYNGIVDSEECDPPNAAPEVSVWRAKSGRWVIVYEHSSYVW